MTKTRKHFLKTVIFRFLLIYIPRLYTARLIKEDKKDLKDLKEYQVAKK